MVILCKFSYSRTRENAELILSSRLSYGTGSRKPLFRVSSVSIPPNQISPPSKPSYRNFAKGYGLTKFGVRSRYLNQSFADDKDRKNSLCISSAC